MSKDRARHCRTTADTGHWTAYGLYGQTKINTLIRASNTAAVPREPHCSLAHVYQKIMVLIRRDRFLTNWKSKLFKLSLLYTLPSILPTLAHLRAHYLLVDARGFCV